MGLHTTKGTLSRQMVCKVPIYSQIKLYDPFSKKYPMTLSEEKHNLVYYLSSLKVTLIHIHFIFYSGFVNRKETIP